MLIIPAIDLYQNQVVRLWQGDFDKVKVYSDDPVGMAKRWAEAGATRIHIVDLNGAKTGRPGQLPLIRKIREATGCEIELGGGLRTAEDIEAALDHGASAVVVGTQAINDETFLRQVVATHSDRVIVSIDAIGETPMIKGWTETSAIRMEGLAERLRGAGVKTVVYTNVAVDGTMRGPSVALLEHVIGIVEMSVIASGGISSLEDIRQLKVLESKGLLGLIIGRALYEDRFTLKDAIAAASGA